MIPIILLPVESLISAIPVIAGSSLNLLYKYNRPYVDNLGTSFYDFSDNIEEDSKSEKHCSMEEYRKIFDAQKNKRG